MSAKTTRIEMRADSASRDRIARAAQALNVPASAFVPRAAAAEADRVLARAEVTLMAAEQFDAIIDSLDVPDEAPALAALTRRRRRFVPPSEVDLTG